MRAKGRPVRKMPAGRSRRKTGLVPAKRRAPPRTVDGYLAALPSGSRAALEKLRRMIQDAAPQATEGISYQIPTFYYRGALVAFAAFKDHCSFFPMSKAVISAHRQQLKGYRTAPGTIRFPADRPLPAALVRKIVRSRIKENEARAHA